MLRGAFQYCGSKIFSGKHVVGFVDTTKTNSAVGALGDSATEMLDHNGRDDAGHWAHGWRGHLCADWSSS